MKEKYLNLIGTALALAMISSVAVAWSSNARAEIELSASGQRILCERFPLNSRCSNNARQVAEARDYFIKRWEPPSSLTEPLQYSLTLNFDGTLQRITPYGQAARAYIERTGMPLLGEPFVSLNKNGQTARIRVILFPDGNVQTLDE